MRRLTKELVNRCVELKEAGVQLTEQKISEVIFMDFPGRLLKAVITELKERKIVTDAELNSQKIP